jgi:alkanesulfonate monooxygenase
MNANRFEDAGVPRIDGVKVFAISPRPRDHSQFWEDTLKVIDLSEAHGFTGVLIFSGHDTPIEPLVVANTLLARTRHICPLVAVNPVYMHPYTVAKTIASFTQLYERQIYLNLVTGASKRFLASIDGLLPHDDRYLRLAEFAQIVQSLCRCEGLTSLHGQFYHVSALQLQPRISEHLQPDYMVAGESDAARKCAEQLGAVGLFMLGRQNPMATSSRQGVHLGVIVRETDEQAEAAARAMFPEAEFDTELAQAIWRHSDSHWKQRLIDQASLGAGDIAGAWLTPFRLGRADCPYVVGGVHHVARVLNELCGAQTAWLVLDIPATEIDFFHAARACELLTAEFGCRPSRQL